MNYADNPYHVLDAFANETRSEIQARMLDTIALAQTAPPRPAGLFSLIEYPERTPQHLNDAWKKLNDIRWRLQSRLLWFTNTSDGDRAAFSALKEDDLRRAVETWEADMSVGARANRARLFHILAIARETFNIDGGRSGPNGLPVPAYVREFTWRRAMKAWKEVLADDAFWEMFAQQDRASGLMPLAGISEVKALRDNAWTVLMEPSREMLHRLVSQREYGQARDYIDDLMAEGVPKRVVAEVVDETFAPMYEALTIRLDEAREALVSESGSPPTETQVQNAYGIFQRRVLPAVRGVARLTGKDFGPLRKLCDRAAAFLEELVAHALELGNDKLATSLQSQANSLLRGAVDNTVTPGGQSNTAASDPGVKRTSDGTKVLIGVGVAVAVIVLGILGNAIDNSSRESSSWSSGASSGADQYSSGSMQDNTDTASGIATPVPEEEINSRTYRNGLTLDQLKDTIAADQATIVLIGDTLDVQIQKLSDLQNGRYSRIAASDDQKSALERIHRQLKNECGEWLYRFKSQADRYVADVRAYNKRVQPEDDPNSTDGMITVDPKVLVRRRTLQQRLSKLGVY
ncbi:MAG TPA: hypothetical protein VHI13_19515 [Candidatus Kapabacteria bacterium]|nr:hypothetical protein [Candidatus Kapabacteria bacterium]